MCGFAGEFLLLPTRLDVQAVRQMAGRLLHRGPDEGGLYVSPNSTYAIGFRRLSVIDPTGSHQPMSSPDGRFVVACNGEIYNYRQLRQELASEGVTFQTAGDTEVLLHLYRLHGADFVHQLRGMFAIAIYDSLENTLLLARDRLGEKPLWYTVLDDRIIFASEAKALLCHPGVRRSPRPEALVQYALMGYVPAPGSAFDGLVKVLPGHILQCDTTVHPPRRYWQPRMTPLQETPEETDRLVRDLIDKAVRLRMVSDVPLGALLSGGMDSAIVTAIMARQAGATGGVRTFTAGFAEHLYDERPMARRVAEHLGTDHTELLIEPSPGSMVEQVVAMYDEPFGDSSAIPSLLICQAARQHVKVALTGDGGDEIFGGYDRYRAMHLAEAMSPAKYLGYRLAAAVAGMFAPSEERSKRRRLIRFVGGLSHPFARQYLSYRAIFRPEDLGRLFTKDFASSVDLDAGAEWFTGLYEGAEDGPEFPDEVSRAQNHDLLTYLPDDLLVKSDIASMASSLELRASLLDHDIVNLGLSLPVERKVREHRGKRILREVFADMLPREVLEQPKRGFGVPLGDWLRGRLSRQMRDLLLDKSFLGRGIFEPAAIHGLVNDHLCGRDDHRHRLWSLMVLARWLDTFGQ